jgi:DNA-binding transcriptional ArsR family regulator
MPPKSEQSKSGKQRADIDRLLHALNHPLRRRILIALAREQRGSSKSLAKAFREHLGVISYHLINVLDEECEVVELVDRVKRRGAWEKFYAFRRESILSILASPDLPDPIRQSLFGASLKEFFGETIAAIEAGAIDSPGTNTLEWVPIQVDGQGWHDIGDAAEQFKQRVRNAIRDSRSRSSSGSKEVLRSAIFGIALYEAVGGLRGLNGGRDRVSSP